MLKNLFEPRCKHRHTKAEHPQCFPRETKGSGLRPNILILDIETAPLEVLVWGLKDNYYIQPTNILKDYFIISWSAKWLFEPKAFGEVVSPKDALERNDKKILTRLWSILDNADIVIAHNGKQFDFKKINTRFILNGFPPPRPFQVIDTLQVCRSIFGFSSNALNYLNKILGLNLKSETDGFELWKKCINGDKIALDKMLNYNKNDVEILEELYVAIRPWIKSHPNIGLYLDLTTPVCRNCGGTDLIFSRYVYTPVGKFQLVRCNCGATGRMRINQLTEDKKKNLVV